MQIGMTLPVTEPGWSRQVLFDWAKGIDEGPFSSLALGERMCFPNPEVISTLAACAVLTQRVRLVTTVLVVPTHDPRVLAKQLATIDVFSEGRLEVGVGTGGREEDYAASGTPLSQKKLAILESHIATMRAIWRGENVVEGALRGIEPLPLQSGGPALLAGVFGPKGMASAARWSAGICGMSMSAKAQEAAAAFEQASSAWQVAGIEEKPRLNTAFWFAMGDDPDAQMETHLNRYFNWLPAAARRDMASGCGFRGNAQQLKDRLQQFADAGADEVHLIPTAIDTDDLKRAAEVVADFAAQ